MITTKKIYLILFTVFFIHIFAQLPVPTLISSQKFSAVGAGASGVPTVSFTIPAIGSNRVVVVNVVIERLHTSNASNNVTGPDGTASVGTLDMSLNPDPNPVGLIFALNSLYTSPNNGYAGNTNYSFYSSTSYITETQFQSANLNTFFSGPKTISFTNLNLPESASDEMSVIVSIYSNVKDVNVLSPFTTFNPGPTTTAVSSFNVTNAGAIPNGRNVSDRLYGIIGASSESSALTLVTASGPGFTSSTSLDNVVTNTATANVAALNARAPNEPDGISHKLWYVNNIPSSAFPIPATVFRTTTGQIAAGHGAFFWLNPLASPSISGNIYNDTTGSNTIEGTLTDVGGNTYINVVDVNNILVYSALIDASGAFSIPTGYVTEQNNYKLMLSKSTGTIGNSTPTKQINGWVYVGESKNPSPFTSDNTPDGILNVSVGSNNITGLRFGVKPDIDSDGDGVYDETDLDDDNDGILDTAECLACTAIFSNGGFESPRNTNPVTGLFHSNPNIIWKTTATNTIIEFWKSGYNGISAAEGDQFVELNATQVSTLYQTSCIPINGGVINWSVKHRGRLSSTIPDVAEVRIGTSLTNYTVVATMSDTNTAWGEYSGVYNIPSGNSGTLYIMFSAVSSSNGDQTIGNFIDDVNLKLVSGCADTDGDGIIDSQDLDSDGDGCPDAIEGGDNVTASMLNGIGRINVAANGTTTPVVVDVNGVPVVTNTGGSANVDGQAQGQTIGQSHTNNPAAVAGTASSNQTISSGNAPAALNLSGSIGAIQWQSSTDNITFTNISGATTSSYSPGTLTSTRYYKAVVSSVGGCTINSNSVIITVVPNTDSDGDGVVDYYDLDGDNDGILDTTEGETIDTDGDGIVNSLDLDSDNDGCLDAIEGDENGTNALLVNSAGTVSVGAGSNAYNQNFCASSSCVDANGIPNVVNSGGAADVGNDIAQGIGSSKDALVNGCACYKAPSTDSGSTVSANHGITALGRAGANNDNWPMVRKGAWTVLEAKTKGFVINRLTSGQISTIPVSNLVTGMMVYNTTIDCLQIYYNDGVTSGWKCFNMQTCPD